MILLLSPPRLPPFFRDRKDVIGAAETGSGKTLAFGLPILQASFLFYFMWGGGEGRGSAWPVSMASRSVLVNPFSPFPFGRSSPQRLIEDAGEGAGEGARGLTARRA